jgi:aldose 1-epimerase
MAVDVVKLESGDHQLHLVPELGGGIAAWNWKSPQGWAPLLRPWDGISEDRYALACFPLVPWSNRITQGGFEHAGIFHPVRPNRADEAYPIHGDGWLQQWHVAAQTQDSIQLALESHAFAGNPYEYLCTQNFKLLPQGLTIALTVTHTGQGSMPYGLGLHPYFLRNGATRLRSKASGVWLSGTDPIPTSHTNVLPPTWDYNEPAPLSGPLIDNCFTGWDGVSVIEYPDRGWSITLSMADSSGYSLMYRPPGLDYFCLEPITHPIDAFHMPERPGLVSLSTGQSLRLTTTLTVNQTAADSRSC